MFSTNRDSFVMKVVSIISVLVLVVGVLPMTVSASDTGFKTPTSTQNPTEWTEQSKAFSSDNDYARTNSDDATEGYVDFNFASFASGTVINGIEVQIDAKQEGTTCELKARLSWNDGANFTSFKTLIPTGSETTLTYGGAADTWGRTWSTSDFTNANFAVEIEYNDPGNGCVSSGSGSKDDIFVDVIRAKVHYTVDADSDGIADGSDNCPSNANPNQANNDGDSQGDVCDTDDDNDGDLDVSDNCPLASNADQADTDSDGTGNVCDGTPNGHDNDGDGIGSALDNCPSDSNVNQSDIDQDGLGDVCDPDDDNDGILDINEPSEICEANGGDWDGLTCTGLEGDTICTVFTLLGFPLPDLCVDTDGDDVMDDEDNCVSIVNPGQVDSDNDGIGNECDDDSDGDDINNDADPCPTDALNTCDDPIDSDGDGIPDSEDTCPNDPENVCDDEGDECEFGCDGCEVDCGEGNEEGNGEQLNDPVPTPGGWGTSNPFATCMNGVDDDNDGLIDMNDSGCGNPFDGSESDAAYGPDGQVLGASTSAEAEDDSGASCPASFAAFIGLNGTTPDPEAVKALQQFLNTELGLTLDVNGDFDAATIDAVKAFQTKYALEVLAPWGITDATGIVFKTTQRMINMILCPGLDLPMPELN